MIKPIFKPTQAKYLPKYYRQYNKTTCLRKDNLYLKKTKKTTKKQKNTAIQILFHYNLNLNIRPCTPLHPVEYRDHPFKTYAKLSEKLTSYFECAIKGGVRNICFQENFAYVQWMISCATGKYMLKVDNERTRLKNLTRPNPANIYLFKVNNRNNGCEKYKM